MFMKKEMREKLMKVAVGYTLPRYKALPRVGLYLEQTVKLINTYLAPFDSMQLTTSMVSNYVKKKMIEGPEKKQYYEQHISRLLFIAMTKSVLSLDDIGMLIALQDKTYAIDVAYDYLCEEFENVLNYTFGFTDELNEVGNTDTEVKDLFTNTITTIVNKIYLDEYIKIYRSERLPETFGTAAQ